MTGNRQTTEQRGRLATALLLLLAAQLLCGFEPFRTTVDAVERGNALLGEGKPKEALEQYEQAAKEQPDLAGVHYNRALALEKLGKLDEARKALLRSSQSNDRQLKAKSFYNLGNVLYQLKQHKEAVTAYQSALRLNPRHKAAKWNLELALRQLEEERKKQESEKKDDKNKDDQKKDDKKKQEQSDQNKQNKPDEQKKQSPPDKANKDQQKQDNKQQRPDSKTQPQTPKPEQRPAAERRMQQLLDSLDRKDRNLQRFRARMMSRRRRPPERDW